jgi:L-lactate dehydrogenase complex protein LldF
MNLPNPDLTERSHAALENDLLQGALKRATTLFIDRRAEAITSVTDWEALRQRARKVKEHTINNLDYYLEQLVEKVEAHGGKVYWAKTGADVSNYIIDLARSRGVKAAVKSKSMTTEEIELNHALEAADVRPIETDLGEYIIQLAHEKPSHIIVPAIHKTREQIADLFAEKLGPERPRSVAEITAVARRRLRHEFLAAEMGITGANFAIAESGTIVLVENEGNIRLSTQVPKIHVAVVGIEKVIPRFDDLSVFLRLLPRSGTGQKQTAYVSFLNGPRQRAGGPATESDFEFHLVLMDNGRTRILADEQMRESLYCIRCGACLNVCPVYQKIGGQAYGWIYPGPIGAVISPQLQSMKQSGDLPFASSLCGACRDACPVAINLPDLLLALRGKAKENRAEQKVGERAAMRGISFVARHPKLFAIAGKVMRRFAAVLARKGRIARVPLGGPLKHWTRYRDLTVPSGGSFRERWQKSKDDE